MNKKLKIAVVHPFFRAKEGASLVMAKIADHFHADVYCIEYNKEKTFESLKKNKVTVIPTLPFPSSRFFDGIKAGFSFYTYNLPEKYDAIIASTSPSEWIRNRNSPVIWYCHSPNKEVYSHYEKRMKRKNIVSKIFYFTAANIFRLLENTVINKIEYIFANSNLTKQRIKIYLNRDSEILYPVFTKGLFRNISYQKYFFYPSRIAPDKRFEYAIEAFKQFKKKGKEKVKDWKLIIAGSLESQYTDYYKKLVEMIKDRDDIEIKLNVPQPELVKLYGNAFCILFTPIEEDFGMVPLEGFESEKPCIAVNEGGPKETIEDGKDGFLVNSSTEMVDKMFYLVSNPSIAIKMGKNGKKKLRQKFSEEHFYKRIEEVVEELKEKRNIKQ